MPDISSLVAMYRSVLQESEPLAPPEEQRLYFHHSNELARLSSLLDVQASSADIAALVAGERRAFGWAFLSGEHGARVESAFHLLASALEALHSPTHAGNNGV
jgi:hypothetical protein